MILYFKVHSYFVKYNMCHFCSNNYMYSHGEMCLEVNVFKYFTLKNNLTQKCVQKSTFLNIFI